MGQATKSAENLTKAANLTPQINSEFGLRQLSEITRALPIFICYHLIATVFMSTFVDEPKSLLHWWQITSIAFALALTAQIYRCRDFQTEPSLAASLLRAMPVVGICMAAIWSVPALVFISSTNADAAVLIYGITLIMWALGVLSWLRMPSVAVLYATFVGVVMCRSIYVGLPEHQILFVLVCAAFWVSLIGLIVTAHIDFERRTRADIEHSRQGQIIKLLLNDFERDSSDWLWETDATGKLSYVSARLAEVLGQTEDKLRGSDFLDALNGEDVLTNTDSLRMLMAKHHGAIDQIIKRSVLEDQYYWQLKARPLFEADGKFKGYRGVGRDVTNQQKSETQILAAKEAAESASAAKSQFLAVISHELRTPINAIVGFSEVLASQQNENISAAERKNYLGSVIESARHLQNLINDILDATRLERGSFRLVEQENDVAEIIEVTLKMCRNQADTAKISIVAHIIDDVTVHGDLTRLKQVLLNLVSNAIKFSPAEAIVNVGMHRSETGQLVVTIRDAGIGISAEDAVRVFEPFVQIDGGSTRSYGGMGLGLSIARRIARLHGGDVTLEGLAGIGTEARLILPPERVVWPATQQSGSMVAA